MRGNAGGGFTLIEVIAVLVLVGIVAGVAIPRYVDLAEAAKRRAVAAGIAEYNGREVLLWTHKQLGRALEGSEYQFDRKIYSEMDPYLDAGFTYVAGTSGEEGEHWYYQHSAYGNASTGAVYRGTLRFQGEVVNVRRYPATYSQPARWEIAD